MELLLPLIRPQGAQRLDKNSAKRRMQRILHYLCLALAVLGPAPASAAGFAECLAGLRGAALAGGVDGGTFDRATRGLTPNPEVLSRAEAQPEFKKKDLGIGREPARCAIECPAIY